MTSTHLNTKAVFAVFLLFLMSILDAFYTDLGIRLDFITEANPLMGSVYESSVAGFYAIKIALPLLMLFIIMKIRVRNHLWFLIGGSLILYSLILAMHIRWITMVTIG